MVATATPSPAPAEPERTALAAVPDAPASDAFFDEQVDAEHSLLRATIIGIVVGMLVCAGVWALLVTIALAGTDWALGPPVWMGAGVGLFAGAFYGGWLGTVIGAKKLEDAEHHSLPRQSR